MTEAPTGNPLNGPPLRVFAAIAPCAVTVVSCGAASCRSISHGITVLVASTPVPAMVKPSPEIALPLYSRNPAGNATPCAAA